MPEERLIWWSLSAHSNMVTSRTVHTRLDPQRRRRGLAAPARLDPVGAAAFLGCKARLELGCSGAKPIGK